MDLHTCFKKDMKQLNQILISESVAAQQEPQAPWLAIASCSTATVTLNFRASGADQTSLDRLKILPPREIFRQLRLEQTHLAPGMKLSSEKTLVGWLGSENLTFCVTHIYL